uniref:ABC transporter substrate-binding protein n=1 Tax=candidate division WOR-3 bacterium TaxID=2052148 RepID=A0A7V3ZU97_UNCW3
MRKFLYSLLILFSTLIFFCEKGEKLKIGLIAPLTGDVKTFGESVKNAFLLAIEEANQKGGILNKKIEYVICDDKNDPTEAANAAYKLINQDKVKAIIGSVASKASIPVSEICEQAKIVMITPTSTNPKVTVREDGTRKKYVFRACFIDPFQGKVAATFALKNLNKKTAAILYDVGNDYVKGLAEYFKASFEEGGGKVLLFESYSKDDVDFSALLTKVKQLNPDILFLPDYYTKVGLIAKQARQLGIKSILMGGDGWDSPDIIKIAGEAIEGGYFTNHYSPEDPRKEVQEWVKKYQERYGKVPDALATLAYDATNLLLTAIIKANSFEPDKIREALENIKEFNTVSGKIVFDENGNPIKDAVIMQYKNGKATYVTTIHP